MDSTISSSLSSTCGSIFSFIAEKAKYFCCLENNFDALETNLKDLLAAREDVETTLEFAKGHKQPLKKVLVWIEKVDAVQTEFKELQRVKSEEIEKLCLGGYYSRGLVSSYEYGEKVAKLLQKVTTLKGEEETFKDVAGNSPAPAVEIPTERMIVGQQSILDEVLTYLKDEQVGMIGLYGMPGVGKTTLLKQINNKIGKELHDVDVVIWVVVSSNTLPEKIQDAIGKRIGLSEDNSWRDKSFEDKAKTISHTLCKKKFALLLDDIWDRIELKEVGVPLQCLNSGSKILFTTRKADVCNKMQADKKVEVKCLKFREALELFQKKVGKDTLESDSRIPELVKEVVKECHCLPLVLIVVGEVMAGKNESSEWKDAIKVLKTSARKFEDMEKNVFSCLKFSYDNLPNEAIKSCFLYCSLFSEDDHIFKRNLIDFWIGDGFLDEYDKGYSIIGTLIRACLLEEVDYSFVKMHDVMREMALWIASDIEKEKGNFLVHTGIGLTEAPEVEKWKGIKRMSLMDNGITSLSSDLTARIS